MPIYEIGTALVCSSLISPVMMVIDTAIIKSQFEKTSIQKAYKDVLNGCLNGTIRYYRPLKIMNGVYFSTYATANLSELYCHTNKIDPKLPTFLLTSIVNMTAILYKDKSYIKMFEKISLKIPLRSYLLFGLRDSMTIGSTFVVKKDMVKYLHTEYRLSYSVADFISSFTLPMMAQLTSTPLHIIAMDYYQRPSVGFVERLRHIYQLYPSISMGRMLRVVPAFCFGGFLNDILRSNRVFVEE